MRAYAEGDPVKASLLWGVCVVNRETSGEKSVALNIEGKKVIIDQVASVAANALSLVAADYRGLSVAALTALRGKARKEGVHVRVVRNTLARRALEGTSFSCAKDALTGPLILGFSQDNPGAAARVFRDFAKDNEGFVVRVLAINGQLLDVKQLGAVASLPTRQEALSKLAGLLQAPLAKLARTLAEPHAKLARTFAALRDQKQSAS